MRSRPRWKLIAYDVLALPRGVLTTTLTLAVWCGSAALLLLPLYVDGLPGDSAKFGLFAVSQGISAWGVALVGLAGLAVLAPWVTRALARLDIATARWLLAPRPGWSPGGPRRSTVRSRSGAASSATSTTAPSSGWWRWP